MALVELYRETGTQSYLDLARWFVEARGLVGTGHRVGWPFEPDSADQVGEEVEVVAIPYYAWANREIGAMRVWLPRG
jgi:DUF1680 family protein